MKLLILGAAGKTGRLVTGQALANGHDVVAFVHHAGKFTATPHLTETAGDAQVPADITNAAAGCDAVISVLGHTSTKHSMAQTEAMTALVAALPAGTRVISLTGFGVPDPKDPPIPLTGRLMNAMIRAIPGAMYEDGARHAQILRDSQLDWTIIRAPRLTGGPATGKYELGYFPMNGVIAIARADVAAAMLACLGDGTWSRLAPMIRAR